MKTVFLFPVTLVVCIACSSNQDSALNAQRKSLEAIKTEHQRLLKSIAEASTRLDSIEYYAKISTASTHHDGNDHAAIANRLKEVGAYVRSTEVKVAKLESALKAYRNKADAYLMMVDAMKGEIEIRDKEIDNLSDSTLTRQTDYAISGSDKTGI
jgi:Zn-dependent M16 (insulinase) family peptidase